MKKYYVIKSTYKSDGEAIYLKKLYGPDAASKIHQARLFTNLQTAQKQMEYLKKRLIDKDLFINHEVIEVEVNEYGNVVELEIRKEQPKECLNLQSELEDMVLTLKKDFNNQDKQSYERVLISQEIRELVNILIFIKG